MQTGRRHRLLFGLVTACGASIFWLAPHPPMIDLPQHAGQLALLKQLVTGDTRWAALFQINPWTPYFLGFGLALPLSFLMPVAAALKTALTLAYLAWVLVCTGLRRHFGADARLDWLCLTPYFGFAFQWGFFTFLTAAPLGLALVWLGARQARAPSTARGARLSLLCVLLLVSHGLIFLYTLGTLALLLAVRGRGRGLSQRARMLWPLALPTVALGVFFVMSRQAEAAFHTVQTVPAVMGHWGIRHEVLTWSQGLKLHPLFTATSLVFLLAPWLMGLRTGPSRGLALLPFAMTALVLGFAPSFVFETSFVYERFSLFLWPAYAWLFAAQPGPAKASAKPVQALLVVMVMAVLGLHGWRGWQFGREASDFDLLTARLEPGQRVLALIADPISPATGGVPAYVHHGLWYQAEYGGLVDFNFAWVQPQVVRYRLEARPPVALNFPWRPQQFDWKQHQGERYRYFLVRTGTRPEPDWFAGAPCRPRLLTAEGNWLAFERAHCATASTNAAAPSGPARP